MTYQLAIAYTDELTSGNVQLRIQIMILAEHFPYLPLCSNVPNFVYVDVDVWSFVFAWAKKKRFVSVLYIQSGCNHSMMSS